MAYRVDEASLTAVADAIREKSGTSEGLTFPEGFVNAVAGIQAGGGGIYVKEEQFTRNTSRTTIIEHNLGRIPKFFAVFTGEGYVNTEKTLRAFTALAVGGKVGYCYFYMGSNTGNTRVNGSEPTVIDGNDLTNINISNSVVTLSNASENTIQFTNGEFGGFAKGKYYFVVG